LCLVNDILDFTKSDFDKEIRIVFEQCNIRKDVKTVEMMLKMRARIRNIDLIIELDENIPLTFCTDPRRLK
jgi:signal transduction histidine kinase